MRMIRETRELIDDDDADCIAQKLSSGAQTVGVLLLFQVNTGDLRYVTFVLYLVTFFVGAVGNGLTIVALCCVKRSAAMCFMLNLAIADALFITSLPFKAHSTLVGRWSFGAGVCKILSVFNRV